MGDFSPAHIACTRLPQQLADIRFNDAMAKIAVKLLATLIKDERRTSLDPELILILVVRREHRKSSAIAELYVRVAFDMAEVRRHFLELQIKGLIPPFVRPSARNLGCAVAKHRTELAGGLDIRAKALDDFVRPNLRHIGPERTRHLRTMILRSASDWSRTIPFCCEILTWENRRESASIL